MKLTEQEVLLFEKLHESELGKQLVLFLERLEAEVCDVRTMQQGDTPESMRRVAEVLRKEVIQRIGQRNNIQPVRPNQCI